MKSAARAAPRPRHSEAAVSSPRTALSTPHVRLTRSRLSLLSLTIRLYRYYFNIFKWTFQHKLTILVLVSYMKLCCGRVDRKRLKSRQEPEGWDAALFAYYARGGGCIAQHPPARHVPPSARAPLHPRRPNATETSRSNSRFVLVNRQAENSINNCFIR